MPLPKLSEMGRIYYDPRLEDALLKGEFERFKKLYLEVNSAQKCLPLTEEQFFRLRGFVYNNFMAYGEFHENIPIMMGFNTVILCGSAGQMYRVIMAYRKYQNPVSKLLLVASGGMIVLAIVVSSTAILAGADFVPQLSVYPNLAAAGLLAAAKKTTDMAEGRDPLDEGQEEESPRLSRWRSFWRRVTSFRQKENPEEIPLITEADKEVILGNLSGLDLTVL